MPRSPAVLVVSVLLILGSVGGAWAFTRGGDRRDAVAAAVDAAPLGSGTVDVTVWSRLPASIDQAALQDLTTRSVVAPLADEIDDRLGWSPAALAWESFVRTPEGPLLVLGLGTLDPAQVDQAWSRVGERDGDGWVLKDGGGTSSDFADTFRHVRVLRDRSLLVAAPDERALRLGVSTVRGRTRSLLADRGVADLVRQALGRDSVMIQAREALCADQSRLDDDETVALRRVERRHGRLADPTWGLRALGTRPDRRYLFATAFTDPGVAREQLDVRRALTTGSFIGRSGTVQESLRDARAQADGSVVVLDLAPTADAEDYMAAVGPVAFSGCAVPGRG